MKEIDSLSQIAAEISNCTLCLLSTTRKLTVPGEGYFHKKLMIIGEAPGYHEDRTGRPFIGAAGKILRNTLTKNSIKFDDVFITNVVKCRPPNNRPPYTIEKKMCIRYLDRQILVLRPEIICLLGNVVSSFILDIKSITRERGKILCKNGMNYFVTYHPAATIYDRNLLKIFELDIEQLAKYLSLHQ